MKRFQENIHHTTRFELVSNKEMEYSPKPIPRNALPIPSSRSMSRLRLLPMLTLLVFGGLFVYGFLNFGLFTYAQQEETLTGMSATQSHIEQIRYALETAQYEKAAQLLKAELATASTDPSTAQELKELQDQLTLSTRLSLQDNGSTEVAPRNDFARDPETMFNDAVRAFEQEEWVNAINQFQQLRRLSPTYQVDAVSQYLGVAYLRAATKIISESPHDRIALQSAHEYFRNVLEMNPAEPTAQTGSELLSLYLAGERELRLGNPRRSVEILQPLYERNPIYLGGYPGLQLYKAYLELGDSSMRRGQMDAGVKFFRQALELQIPDKSMVEERMDGIARLQSLAAPAPTPVPVAPIQTTQVTQVVIQPAQPQAAAQPAAPAEVVAPTPEPLPVQCADTRINVTHPKQNEVLSGRTQVRGTVTHENFQYYKLEFAPEDSVNFAYFDGRDKMVVDDYLGGLDTSTLPNGNYVIRVIVVDQTGNYPTPCEVNISVQN